MGAANRARSAGAHRLLLVPAGPVHQLGPGISWLPVSTFRPGLRRPASGRPPGVHRTGPLSPEPAGAAEARPVRPPPLRPRDRLPSRTGPPARAPRLGATAAAGT